jgi:glycosyltransferase involved in cell wall biosynthesis
MVMHARVVTGTGGGPDKTILNSARFLDSEGYRTLCVFMRDPSDALFAELEERARQWHAPILAVDDHGALDWRVMGRLREVCSLYRPAIWHGHDYKSNLLGLRIQMPALRRVTTVHGWVRRTWKTPLYYWLDRRSIRRYDQVICVSTDLYERCLDFGVPAERCWYVPNGVDTDEFRRDTTREEAKARLGAPLDRPLIGMVGRLSSEKRCDLVIRALGLLRESGVEAELWIAGEGPERARLEGLVAESDLAERVQFRGYVADTKTLYQALDLLVMSSVREGLPNALLEAMAFEVPVVATRIAGIPGLIVDGENGFLVDAASGELLQRAVTRLIASPDLAKDLGRAARRTVVESFSFAGRMTRIRRIYDETLGVASSAAGGGA